MSIILVTCHVAVVKNVELRTGVRGQSEWKNSGWRRARGHESVYNEKNIGQKGVSKDNKEQI